MPASGFAAARCGGHPAPPVCGMSEFAMFNCRSNKLPVPPPHRISAIVQHRVLAATDATPDIGPKASELPPIHSDRFIVAAALLQNAPVATADKRFALYGIEVLI
jgi:PIN domain nuclease of toxin-antitoxin system